MLRSPFGHCGPGRPRRVGCAAEHAEHDGTRLRRERPQDRRCLREPRIALGRLGHEGRERGPERGGELPDGLDARKPCRPFDEAHVVRREPGSLGELGLGPSTLLPRPAHLAGDPYRDRALVLVHAAREEAARSLLQHTASVFFSNTDSTNLWRVRPPERTNQHASTPKEGAKQRARKLDRALKSKSGRASVPASARP